jgi:hypothetical protein
VSKLCARVRYLKDNIPAVTTSIDDDEGAREMAAELVEELEPLAEVVEEFLSKMEEK